MIFFDTTLSSLDPLVQLTVGPANQLTVQALVPEVLLHVVTCPFPSIYIHPSPPSTHIYSLPLHLLHFIYSLPLFSPSLLHPWTQPEVSKVDIDMEAQKVNVESSLSSDEILALLKKTGRECSYIGTN